MAERTKKVGLIVPSVNTVVEPEFNESFPAGVTGHVVRMSLSTDSTEDDRRYPGLDQIEGSLDLLMDVDPDLIVYACTMSSIENGPFRVESEIEDRTGVPAISTAASIVRALEALDVHSLSISTPYDDVKNEREREFFEDEGFDVRSISGAGVSGDEADQFTADEVYDAARAVFDDDADCLFISCMNYRTFDVITRLERDLDVPVVSSNQATLWDALRHLDVEYENPDLGTLTTPRGVLS